MRCYKQSDVINLKKKGKGKKEGNKERRRKEEREYIDTYKIMLIPKNHHFSKNIAALFLLYSHSETFLHKEIVNF